MDEQNVFRGLKRVHAAHSQCTVWTEFADVAIEFEQSLFIIYLSWYVVDMLKLGTDASSSCLGIQVTQWRPICLGTVASRHPPDPPPPSADRGPLQSLRGKLKVSSGVKAIDTLILYDGVLMRLKTTNEPCGFSRKASPCKCLH